MNDGQDPYDPYAQDPYGQEPRIHGYDAYGRPVYQPQPQGEQPRPVTTLRPAALPGGLRLRPVRPGAGAQDPGAAAPRTHERPPYDAYDPYAAQHDPHTGQQPRCRGRTTGTTTGRTTPAPRPASSPPSPRSAPGRESGPEAYEARGHPGSRGRRRGARRGLPDRGVLLRRGARRGLRGRHRLAEVRRDPHRAAGRAAAQVRNRAVALVVVLVLAVAGGVGYLWQAGKLPGLGSEDDTASASGPQKRDVIVVHLRETRGGGSSTALLVDNVTTKKGTTVLLPNDLGVATEEGGSTTLGKSVVDEGSDATRESLSTLLGSSIQGTWRLDTRTWRTSSSWSGASRWTPTRPFPAPRRATTRWSGRAGSGR
ncbi:hypothetical protein NKH77_18150 [Streptomyces sp. M19]